MSRHRSVSKTKSAYSFSVNLTSVVDKTFRSSIRSLSLTKCNITMIKSHTYLPIYLTFWGNQLVVCIGKRKGLKFIGLGEKLDLLQFLSPVYRQPTIIKEKDYNNLCHFFHSS